MPTYTPRKLTAEQMSAIAEQLRFAVDGLQHIADRMVAEEIPSLTMNNATKVELHIGRIESMVAAARTAYSQFISDRASGVSD